MRPLGQRELRMGPTAAFGDSVFGSYSPEAEMTVCDRCRELKLFLPEEAFLKPACPPEERCLREFAACSDTELRRIAESRCQPEARQAAAAPAEQRCRQEQAKTSRAVRHRRFYSICLRLPLQAPAQRDDTSAAGIPGGHDQHV